MNKVSNYNKHYKTKIVLGIHILVLLCLQSCIGKIGVAFSPVKDTVITSAIVTATPGVHSQINITGGASPSPVRQFSVSNLGNIHAEALDVTLSNTTNFEFANSSCDGVVLAPNETCIIEVRAKSLTNEAFTGDLQIESGSFLQVIPLSGVSSGFVLPFVTSWKTNNPGSSAANQITLPLSATGIYNFVVNWGDGTQNTITTWNDPVTTHTYSSPGTYTVTMTGVFDTFAFNGSGDPQKLLDITKWGTNSWATFADAFAGCSNLSISATDAPNLDVATNMSGMFTGATSFNSSIDHWDTSNITNMSGMFYYATSFNQILNHWNVSKVTHMGLMFNSATSFNQDLDAWDTSSLDNAYAMFANANFNKNISTWNMSNVTSMTSMFSANPVFNQNIGSWDTSKVIYMHSMFQDATAFNQNIGNWNTGNVVSMNLMFNRASAFNQNISNWNTTKVTNMYDMFAAATQFNQNIGSWNTANVINMSGMFNNAINFNQNIGSWNTAKVTNMSTMFQGALAFNQNIGGWNTERVNNMSYMFYDASAFNQNISGWNTSMVTNMNFIFHGATTFNQNLSPWVVTGVSTYSGFDTNTPAWVLAKPNF